MGRRQTDKITADGGGGGEMGSGTTVLPCSRPNREGYSMKIGILQGSTHRAKHGTFEIAVRRPATAMQGITKDWLTYMYSSIIRFFIR